MNLFINGRLNNSLFMYSIFFIVFMSLGFVSCNESDGQSTNENTFQKEENFTPIVFSVMSHPNPVEGSDDQFHIVYELFVTNSNRFEWEIISVDVVDGDQNEKVLFSFSGDEVVADMQLLGTREHTNTLQKTLQPNQAGITYSMVRSPERPDSYERLICWQ